MGEPDWSALRAEFPLLDRCTYLNACSLGPLPRAGREALARYAADWDREGTPVWYSTWLPLTERLRARVGQLLGTPADSVALAPSVSVALTTLASCRVGVDAIRRRLPGFTTRILDRCEEAGVRTLTPPTTS